ncbi:MAG TPA: TetR/AcrR family transcriptional regulator [Flavobacterium sp.]|nr:TetR/AcrR family transcriptional regulator [Flavobacterium sp.]
MYKTARPDRKTEIVAHSATLFKEKGYSAVTMRDIAHSLDIKAASLYNHITSKQEILSLVVLGIAREYTNTIEQIVSSNDTAVDKLKQVIALHIDITVRNPDGLASLNNDWMHLPPDDLALFLSMRESYENYFRAIVKNGIESGELRAFNAEVIIFSMLSTLRTLYLGKSLNFRPKSFTATCREYF